MFFVTILAAFGVAAFLTKYVFNETEEQKRKRK